MGAQQVESRTSGAVILKVFYNAFAIQDIYHALRLLAPSRIEGLALTTDTEEERATLVAACECMICASSLLSAKQISEAPLMRAVVIRVRGLD